MPLGISDIRFINFTQSRRTQPPEGIVLAQTNVYLGTDDTRNAIAACITLRDVAILRRTDGHLYALMPERSNCNGSKEPVAYLEGNFMPTFARVLFQAYNDAVSRHLPNRRAAVSWSEREGFFADAVGDRDPQALTDIHWINVHPGDRHTHPRRNRLEASAEMSIGGDLTVKGIRIMSRADGAHAVLMPSDRASGSGEIGLVYGTTLAMRTFIHNACILAMEMATNENGLRPQRIDFT